MHLEGSTWGEACNRDKHVSSGNQALAYQTLWTEKIVRDEIACPLASSVFLIIMPVPYS